jgi:3-phosphoshikimate 1-carboxyvinyltransferase
VSPATAPLDGRSRVPASKSLAQRALVLAVLADGRSEVVAEGPPSEDVSRLAGALTGLTGAHVPPSGGIDGAFGPRGLGADVVSRRLDLGMNGTGFRFAVALAALRPAGARTLVTGAPRLLARPHAPLLRALHRLGAHVIRRGSGAVRVIGGAWAAHEVAVPADVSSQFASALLLAAPRAGGLALRLVGDAVSDAYTKLTVATMARFGVAATHEGSTWTVAPGAPRAARLVVEADASSAAVWWAAAARAGGHVVVEGLPADSAQPDLALLEVLSRMGATVRRTDDGLVRVEGAGGPLRAAGDVDLRDTPDLAPLVAALAADADGETRIVRAPHLRWKESDRIATLVAAVRAVGGDAEARDDGLVVRGRALAGGRVSVRGDHRIALAFGALGLAVPGVVLEGAEAVSKSWPGFLEDLALRGRA